MWQFYTKKKWMGWSLGVTALLVVLLWFQVHFDIKINEWFGSFYNLLQEALTNPHSVSQAEFIDKMVEFGVYAGAWVMLGVVVTFIGSHWAFRWRMSMTEYFQKHYETARHIEGASQRVQEDTMKFARLVEDLGIKFVEALFLLIAFIPILWTLSKEVTELPWIGPVDHSLVIIAILTAIGGTVVLAIAGKLLPGIEYDIQKREAAYRKRLVIGEDSNVRPKGLRDLFKQVRGIHYKSYFHYLYFNVVKLGYLQGMVLIPYIALAPTIITGAVTLGFVTQTTRAFGKVAESLQYLVRSWHVVIELMSVYKRLREFEKEIK